MKYLENTLKSLAGLMFLITVFTCGYYITMWMDIGNPLIRQLAGSLAGILVSISIMAILRLCFQEKFTEHHHNHPAILNAFNEVAKGNFNVLLETGNGPHDEIIVAFNKMVRDLGSLENMRQDFIDNVSHEFQSPLTSIGGFAELLQNEHNPHYAKIIENEAKRLSKLSENLLKLSSLENVDLTKQNYRLDKQIRSIILMFEPQWTQKNITIDLDLEAFEYNGNEELLSQVWINLIQNAIKFTKSNIEITLKNNLLTIKDDGIGISDEDKIHIFEKFYKVDKARSRELGGNGLGLSIAKKILELHNATIDVKSEIEKGCEFTINLN
ncbi:MAG: HAMP domain-containing histidine kinase [Clostridioides sp.]|jgi:signal transduction histidine kinase|nr:HAMP domain-containing histidine kinase [Clostridioides sp.]